VFPGSPSNTPSFLHSPPGKAGTGRSWERNTKRPKRKVIELVVVETRWSQPASSDWPLRPEKENGRLRLTGPA